MQIQIVLIGILRERLAKETQGRLNVELPENSSIEILIQKLDIQMPVRCSVNGQIERDKDYIIQPEDEIRLFLPIGGG